MKVMEPPVTGPAESPPRSRRPRRSSIPIRDVCFGADVAAELVRLIDGATPPNTFLLELAEAALDRPVHPTAAHRHSLETGDIVVFPIDEISRDLLRYWLLGDERPPAKTCATLRRLLTGTAAD